MKMDSTIVEIAKILLNILLYSKEEPLITYGELSRRLPFPINPRNLDQPLGTLSDICSENRMPLISTIVVNQDTLMPGNGYFRYYFPGAKEQDWDRIFIEQYNRIKEFEQWEDLADLLGIEVS